MKLVRPKVIVILLAATASSVSNAQLYRIQDVQVPAVAAKPGTASGARLRTSSDIISHDPRAMLGKGFDVFTGEIVRDAPCLEGNGNDGGFGETAVGQTREFFAHQVVDSISSHQQASGQSVGFGVTYKIFSASASTGTQSDNYFNASDTFGRVYHSIVTRGAFRDGGQWSTRAAQLLTEISPADFLKACGTHYVAAIYWGHVIDETMWFSLKVDRRTVSDSNNLSVGIKDILSLNGSSTTTTTDLSSLATATEVRENYGLLATSAPPPKADPATSQPNPPAGAGQPTSFAAVRALLEYSRTEFPRLVAASTPDQAAVLYIEVRPYRDRVLPDLDRVPAWPDDIFELLKGKALLLEQLTTEISNLNYALGLDGPGAPATQPAPHPTQNYDVLYATPRPDAEQKLKDAVEVRRKFLAAVKTCRGLMLGATGANAATACGAALDGAIDWDKVKAAAIDRKRA